MELRLIAVGRKGPAWVSEAWADYSKRLPRELNLQMQLVSPVTHGATEQKKSREGEAQLKKLPKSTIVVALDEHGKNWSTRELSKQLDGWMNSGQSVAFLVGGADGLSDDCKARADVHWSLSRLTLPHAMVRVVLAEQIYRAWSLLSGHPYHRE